MSESATKRERMKVLASKLKAMSDSASEIGNDDEAKAFAVKMQKIMHQYSIDLSEIEYANVRDDAIITRHVRMSEVGHKDMHKSELWSRTLAYHTASFFFCRVSHFKGTNAITVYGREEHVESYVCTLRAFVYLTLKLGKRAYHKIYWEVRPPKSDMSVTERRAILKGFRSSWKRGFADGIHAALSDQVEKRKSESVGECALVRLKDMLTTVNNYVSENIKFSKAKSTAHADYSNARGMREGYDTGRDQVESQRHLT